jgi:hypothetical protein
LRKTFRYNLVAFNGATLKNTREQQKKRNELVWFFTVPKFNIIQYQHVAREMTRAFCQKNTGSVKIKQRPIKMGGRNLQRTPSPRTPSKFGLTDDPTCKWCLKKLNQPHTSYVTVRP